MSSILRKATWPVAVIAATLMAMAVFGTAQATNESDGVNEATLVVDQGSCPDYQLAVTVTGDDDSPIDVRINGDKQELHGGSPSLEPGEVHVFDQAGQYELDVVDGGKTADVLVFDVEDSVDAAACSPTNWSLIIEKDTDPEDDDFEEHKFSFDVDPGPSFNLKDDDVSDTFYFNPGQDVTITEDQDDGWDLDSVDCDGVDSDDVSVDFSTGEVNIDGGNLDAGDEVFCLFTNVPEVPAPTPTPVVVDVCADIEGIQQTVPVGHDLKLVGNVTICPLMATPTPPPAVISPPNTGDAGLADVSDGISSTTRAGLIGGVILLVVGSAVAIRRYSI